jgi:hypothetical protein
MDTLIKLVFQDRYWRMQMLVTKEPRAESVNDFAKIRAVSGHADNCNISHDTFFPRRLRVERTTSTQGMKGPKHAFFYTDVKGLFNMWDSNGIRPDTSTFGNHSSTMIYMCPVPLTDIDCPDGCQIYEHHQTLVVVIDFEMIVDDAHTHMFLCI